MPDVQNPLGSAPVDVKVVLGKTKMALELIPALQFIRI